MKLFGREPSPVGLRWEGDGWVALVDQSVRSDYWHGTVQIGRNVEVRVGVHGSPEEARAAIEAALCSASHIARDTALDWRRVAEGRVRVGFAYAVSFFFAVAGLVAGALLAGVAK